MHQLLKFILGMKLYMFRTVPLSIVRRFSLYTQQWYMSYRFADSLRAGLGWNCVIQEPVWHIPLLCVQWKSPDDGQRTKHVEFHSKNKFEKLVYLVGFIIRNLTRCTVTWTSNSFRQLVLCTNWCREPSNTFLWPWGLPVRLFYSFRGDFPLG
jgi:hypothetical protein